MYVIPKLRLNRFKACAVPSARRLFSIFGFSAPKVESQQTAADLDQVIPSGARKTQLLGLGAAMAEKAVEFQNDPKGTKPLQNKDPKSL